MRPTRAVYLGVVLTSLWRLANSWASIPGSPVWGDLDFNTRIRVLLARDLAQAGVASLDGELMVTDGKVAWQRVGKRLAFTQSQGTAFVNGRKITARALFVKSASPQASALFQSAVHRGILEIRVGPGAFMAVSHLSMNDYLTGILNGEMGNAWELEALKAQAIAARSYALYMKAHPRHRYYDVEGTTMDQAFLSPEKEPKRLRRAVNETDGLVLTRSSQVVKAFYHSRCGGHTETDSDVWRGKGQKFSSVPCPYCQRHPHRWSALVAWNELKSVLDLAANKLQIFSVEHTPTGRVATMALGIAGQIRQVTADGFRHLFGTQRIKSGFFGWSLGKKGLRLDGVGVGHGVGMCQWGARGLAKSGKSHQEILRHYFPNFSVERYARNTSPTPRR